MYEPKPPEERTVDDGKHLRDDWALDAQLGGEVMSSSGRQDALGHCDHARVDLFHRFAFPEAQPHRSVATQVTCNLSPCTLSDMVHMHANGWCRW